MIWHRLTKQHQQKSQNMHGKIYYRTCMAKFINRSVMFYWYSWLLYCLMNQINRNSSIANSHHIQKILEKAKIKSKYSEKWWPQVGLLFPYSLHNFSITSNSCWVIWINSDLFLFKDTKSCLKLLLYLKEYALQQILITSKSQVSTKKIRQLSKNMQHIKNSYIFNIIN